MNTKLDMKNALQRMPRINALIRLAPAYEANQMRDCLLYRVNNSRHSIDNMSFHQLFNFTADLIDNFKYRGLMSRLKGFEVLA